MSRARTFNQSAVRRAIAAVRKEGLEVYSTAIQPDGTIVITHAAPAPSIVQLPVDSKQLDPDYASFEA